MIRQPNAALIAPAFLLALQFLARASVTFGQCEIHESVKFTDPSAAAGDLFGASVSVSGDVAVVGAYLDECAAGQNCGSAYAYRFNGISWAEEQKLTASDAAAGDYFGLSVSVSGDVAVIGAPIDVCGDGRYCGSAYVYRFNGSSWVEEAKLTASDAANSDFFGYSVSISGDVVVVGAPEAGCGAQPSCGSAYIYRFHPGVPGQWVEEQKLTATNPAQNDSFGASVAVSGSTTVVGVPRDNCATGADCGSAYVYRFDSGAWIQEANLTAGDAEEDDRFGSSVSVSGDVAIAGARNGRCSGKNTPCGSAYVFRFNPAAPGHWVEEQKLTASDPSPAYPGDIFGNAVSVSGNVAVVAAYADDCTAGNDCGSAYVHRLRGNTWIELAKLTASDGTERDYFGYSVSVSGDVAFVGAFQSDCGAGEDCGSAYHYSIGGTGPTLCDCNGNGIEDDIDIASGGSADANHNGVPDECEPGACCGSDGTCGVTMQATCSAGSWSVGLACDPNPCPYVTGVEAAGCRYFRVTPNPMANPNVPVAIRVDRSSPSCTTKYVLPDGGLGRLIDFPLYLSPGLWGTSLVTDTEVVPGATYNVRTETAQGMSNPVAVTLPRWGDVRGATASSPPDGIVNFMDISAIVACFQNSPNAPPMERCDLRPAIPDQSIDFLDVSAGVDAFKGKPYPFPMACP